MRGDGGERERESGKAGTRNSLEKKFFAFLTRFRRRAPHACPRLEQILSIGKRCRSSVERIFQRHTVIRAIMCAVRAYLCTGNLFCLCSTARKFARGTYASRAVPLRSDEYVDSIRLLVRSPPPFSSPHSAPLPSILIRSRRHTSPSRLKLQLSCYWVRIMRNRENANVIAFFRSVR